MTVKAKKAKAKKADVAGKSRAWNQEYEFVKPMKVEPLKDTMRGTVYSAIQKVGKGNVDAVAAKAVALGLGDQTKQDPRGQTQILLRQLVATGSVRLIKHTASAPKAGATAKKASPASKAVAKTARKAKAGKAKRVRLVPSKASESGQAASA